MKILVIVPTYNEKNNIIRLIPTVLKQNNNIEVLVVDDNSPDGTGSAIDQIVAKNNRVKVIHRQRKNGYGFACVEGFQFGLRNGYQLICQMDADFSHNPKYLNNLLDKSTDYDVVLGSRWVKGGGVVGWPWYRYLSSRGANLFARTLFNLKPKDITTGYRCYHREVLEKVDLGGIVSSGYAFLEEMLYRIQRAGFQIGEVPIIFVDRKIGKSKMGLREIFTSSRALLKLYFQRKRI